MRMESRKFRIGELAKKLEVEKFVIRFWEKEFDLKSHRSHGGQRFYEEKDIATFSTIKDLLYNQRLTIAGAKKQLTHSKRSSFSGARLTPLADMSSGNISVPAKELLKLRKKLVRLKELI